MTAKFYLLMCRLAAEDNYSGEFTKRFDRWNQCVYRLYLTSKNFYDCRARRKAELGENCGDGSDFMTDDYYSELLLNAMTDMMDSMEEFLAENDAFMEYCKPELEHFDLLWDLYFGEPD